MSKKFLSNFRSVSQVSYVGVRHWLEIVRSEFLIKNVGKYRQNVLLTS